MPHDDLLDFAVRLALRAGALSRELFLAGVAARTKADGTEVTDADLAVEELLLSQLARHFPDDALLGEESGETAGRSGNRWALDPISGTGYFTRRMPLFANLIGYEDAAGPLLGVINLPMQQELVVAVRGGGCHLVSGDDPERSRRVRVDSRTGPYGALTLAANQHAWSTELVTALHRRVALAGAIHHPVLHLVTGRADAVVMTHQGYDDLAPLPVIVAEAGGVVTDLGGGPCLTGDGTVLAAGPALHRQLLRTVAGLPRTRGSKALAQPPELSNSAPRGTDGSSRSASQPSGR